MEATATEYNIQDNNEPWYHALGVMKPGQGNIIVIPAGNIESGGETNIALRFHIQNLGDSPQSIIEFWLLLLDNLVRVLAYTSKLAEAQALEDQKKAQADV